MGEQGYPVSTEEFRQGVETIQWPGRLEIVSARPWVVLDCAHNEPALRAVAESLPTALQYRRLVLVLGMSADKEVAAAVARIAPLADEVILTQALMKRALWASELTRVTWSLWRTTPRVRWTVAKALGEAKDRAGPEDCILVTGSVFVVGEALQALGLPVR